MTTTTLGKVRASLMRPSSAFWPLIAKIRIEPPAPGLGDQVDPGWRQGSHHAARRVHRRDEEVTAGRRPGLLESGRVPEDVGRVEQRAPRQIRIESVDDADRARYDQEDRGAGRDGALVHNEVARLEPLDERRRQGPDGTAP